MTLSSALRTATSSISTASQQAAVTSRNIAGVGDPNYVRRESGVATAIGGTTTAQTTRYVNTALQGAVYSSDARMEKWDAISSYMDRMAAYQLGNELSGSPSAMIGELTSAIELAAATPSDGNALASLVETARNFSNSLRDSYTSTLSMKAEVDAEISTSVTDLNSKLSKLKELNDAVVDGTTTGRDVFDEMDARDAILADISGQVGIKVIARENNDLLVTLSNGVMLFDGNPRNVSFSPSPSYGPGTQGGDLTVDGVPVAGPNTRMPLNSGKLAGLIEVRDTVLVAQQNELDEIARGLISQFAETDQTAGGKPPLTGLFDWSGGPSVPASGLLEQGIAATIDINALVDFAAGGNPELLRDGAINGDADYLSNSGGGVGFSDRLLELASNIDTQISFDPSLGLSATASLSSFAAESLGSFNDGRQNATNNLSYLSQLSSNFTESLQNENGVNLDVEMSRLLEIERSYQASAKLISAVDEMLATLIASV